jgi:hypothetical protein
MPAADGVLLVRAPYPMMISFAFLFGRDFAPPFSTPNDRDKVHPIVMVDSLRTSISLAPQRIVRLEMNPG